VALLGNTPSAYGQVWHALTSKEPMTGEQYVRIACQLAGKPFKIPVAPRWMLGLMGLFVPVLRENMEMLCQFEDDYRFDSSKLEQALGMLPTDYREGIRSVMA
jgi:nucleoside-diphosphate-sugar epimerase